MTNLWKIVIFGRQEKERKERVFMSYKEGEKEKSFLFFIFFSPPSHKTLSLESRMYPLIGKAWKSKENRREDFDCENQET